MQMCIEADSTSDFATHAPILSMLGVAAQDSATSMGSTETVANFDVIPLRKMGAITFHIDHGLTEALHRKGLPERCCVVRYPDLVVRRINKALSSNSRLAPVCLGTAFQATESNVKLPHGMSVWDDTSLSNIAVVSFHHKLTHLIKATVRLMTVEQAATLKSQHTIPELSLQSKMMNSKARVPPLIELTCTDSECDKCSGHRNLNVGTVAVYGPFPDMLTAAHGYTCGVDSDSGTLMLQKQALENSRISKIERLDRKMLDIIDTGRFPHSNSIGDNLARGDVDTAVTQFVNRSLGPENTDYFQLGAVCNSQSSKHCTDINRLLQYHKAREEFKYHVAPHKIVKMIPMVQRHQELLGRVQDVQCIGRSLSDLHSHPERVILLAKVQPPSSNNVDYVVLFVDPQSCTDPDMFSNSPRIDSHDLKTKSSVATTLHHSPACTFDKDHSMLLHCRQLKMGSLRENDITQEHVYLKATWLNTGESNSATRESFIRFSRINRKPKTSKFNTSARMITECNDDADRIAVNKHYTTVNPLWQLDVVQSTQC
jgi:hypothetical protein